MDKRKLREGGGGGGRGGGGRRVGIMDAVIGAEDGAVLPSGEERGIGNKRLPHRVTRSFPESATTTWVPSADSRTP